MTARRRTRIETRRKLLVAALALAATACGSLAELGRPEGDGGWSAARRTQEMRRLSAAARTDFGAAQRTTVRGSAAAEASPLDLRAALQLASSGNRRIIESGELLEIARERVLQSRGRLLPGATASGRYTWYSDPQSNQIRLPSAGGSVGTSPQSITVRDAEFGVVNATANWPLDFSGELRHTLAAAQAGYRGEQARLWATTLAEQSLVVRSYFELLEAERLREVAAQTAALHRQQLADAESRFRTGRLTKNELLVVQVALQDSEQQLRQRDLVINQARWKLNEAIGLEVNAPTRLADVATPPPVPDADTALGIAYQKNPLIRSLVEEQQRLEETRIALERSRLPRFAGGGAIDASSSDLLQPQRIESGFVGFTWEFTSAEKEARIAEARIAAEQNRTRIEEQLREIEAAVRSAQANVEERLSALVAAGAAVGQAEENLRIRQQQFLAGRATSENVLDAEALLAAERATLASALYQAHVRRAELQQLMGLPLEETISDSR